MKKIVVKERSTLIIIIMCAWCHVFNTYHFYSMDKGLGAKSIDRFLRKISDCNHFACNCCKRHASAFLLVMLALPLTNSPWQIRVSGMLMKALVPLAKGMFCPCCYQNRTP